MEVTRTVTETKVSIGDYKIFNFDELLKLALQNEDRLQTLPTISASGELQLDLFREVTGEDILAYAAAVGGTVRDEDIERDEDGLITSITASIETAFEYDSDEMLSILDDIQAAGVTPKKLLGDLAQTSVSVNGVQTQVIALAEWTLSWKRKTAEATTTDDAEYESSIASTKSWSVKAKFMFVDGDSSQQTFIYAAINALSNDASLWNFFPTVETGRAAFQGLAIVDGIDIATGMGKCVGSDVSLKGTGPLLVLSQAAPVANANTVTGTSAQV